MRRSLDFFLEIMGGGREWSEIRKYIRRVGLLEVLIEVE